MHAFWLVRYSISSSSRRLKVYVGHELLVHTYGMASKSRSPKSLWENTHNTLLPYAELPLGLIGVGRSYVPQNMTQITLRKDAFYTLVAVKVPVSPFKSYSAVKVRPSSENVSVIVPTLCASLSVTDITLPLTTPA